MDQITLRLDQSAFSCAVCLDLLRDPVTIACGHSYCRSCVESHWDTEESKMQVYSCPQCRKTFTLRPVLVKNTMLAFLVEELKKPGLQEAEQSPAERGRDPQELILKIQTKERELDWLRLKETELCACADGVLGSIEDHFTGLTLRLQNKQTEVDQSIRSQYNRHKARIEGQKDPLQQEVTQLRQALTRLDPLAVVPDPSFIPCAFPLDKLPQFDDVKKATLALMDKLSQTLNEGMGPVNSALQRTATPPPRVDSPLSSPEPKTRGDLLKHASCAVPMDPSAAHPFLSLSEGNRRVTFTGVNQKYPENRQRFTDNWQVISKHSLTGHKYWEVEWSAKGQVRIVVLNSDIPRKDPVASLFGNTNRSWALHCDKSRFSVWSDAKESNVEGPVSDRIGLYLNTLAGILCFYSVSQTAGMTLLHRVQTRFRGPVRVGFGFYLSAAGDTACFRALPWNETDRYSGF